MIMLEALVLALFATSVGAMVGAGTASAIDLFEIALPKGAVQTVLMSDTLHLDISLRQILNSVLSFSFVTVLAALWPAIRAARLEPVKAIHKT
jgi:ABC-type antimicrobial peptide transport system permease subunit